MKKTFHAIQKKGENYAVVAKHSGRVLGTHPNREKALAQLRAVEVNMHDTRNRIHMAKS